MVSTNFRTYNISIGIFQIILKTKQSLPTNTSVGNVTTSQDYDSSGAISYFEADYSGSSIFQTSYQRDSLNRISILTEVNQGKMTVKKYAYDTLGRLSQVWKNDTLVSTYSYDPNGNRITHWTQIETDSGKYDAQDRMLSYGNVQYIYSKNGELQKKIIGSDTTSYVYDYFGNLLSVRLPNNDLIEYLIDGQNGRIGKKINGAIVKKWIYAGGLSPIAELDSAYNVTAEFVGSLMIKYGNTYQLITDHLGSVRMVVDVNSGAVVQQIEYDEFGNVLSDSNPDFQPFAFAGGLYDAQTRLVRFGARDYDALSGRWTCKDPIYFAGGEPCLYGYVGDDPINNIDPSGLEKIKLIDMQKLIHENNFSGQSDELILALTYAESTFEPLSWNSGTITGLMQVSEDAGIDVGYPYEDFTSDPDEYDENSNAQNIQAGSLYLENRINYSGENVENGLGEYNGWETIDNAYGKEIIAAEKALKLLKNPCEKDIMKILNTMKNNIAAKVYKK